MSETTHLPQALTLLKKQIRPAHFFHRLQTAFALGLLAGILFSLPAIGYDDQTFNDLIQPVFKESCVKCHGAKEKIKGDVNLMELKSVDDLAGKPELIQDMIDVLEFEEMPPEDEEPLQPALRAKMVNHLNALLQLSVAAQRDFPATPIRRMNRFQYNNAVQDLFDLKVEVFALPERMVREHGNYFQPQTGVMPDTLKAGSRPLGKSQLIDRNRLGGVAPFPQDLRAEHGFDNRADHLSLSPLLMESFLNLGQSIVDSDDFNEKTCGIWNSFFADLVGVGSMHDAVENRLRGFLGKAFRKPVEASTLDRYTHHVLSRIRSGDSFTNSMKEAASAALSSPRFLYLYDRDTTAPEAPANDFELASRLSFFLWGSIPDPTLLNLAEQGILHQPEILEAQTKRMLKDKKIKRFCDSFPSQWLQLERIISAVPDEEKFPEFYFAKFRTSMHMMLEPLLLFETILVENRSLLELIDSDFSYRSELLDAWYQGGPLPTNKPPTSVPFHRVPVIDRREGGVITTAAVMTMTSNPLRTKPITRGAWIASVVFNDPPEPPPADVPPLPEDNDAVDIQHLTLRERFEAHRKNTECMGCHKRIDPLGFALENYGPTGLWRDHYENGLAVDSSGTLFGKYDFNNIVEFKDAILSEKDRFTRAFAAHLLSFSLGRELSVADSPSLTRIVDQTKAKDYALQTLIQQVVLSESFQHLNTLEQ